MKMSGSIDGGSPSTCRRNVVEYWTSSCESGKKNVRTFPYELGLPPVGSPSNRPLTIRMKFALSMAAEKVFLPIKPNMFLRSKVPEEDRRSSACRKGMRTPLLPPPLSRRSITTFTPGSASTSASISENAIDIGKDVEFSQTLYLKKTVFDSDKYSYQ